MASLTGQSIPDSYDQLLTLPDGGGDTSTLKAITDGDGATTFAIQLASDKVNFTGNVGIGTTTPAAHFEVVADPGQGDSIRMTGGAPGIVWTDTGDTDSWRMIADGEYLRIDYDSDPTFGSPLAPNIAFTNTGNVGIGTTAPATKLHVVGGVQVGVSDTGHDVQFFGATASRYWKWDEGSDSVLQPDNVYTKWGSSNDMWIYHDGSNSYIKHDGTGNLKIGTTASENIDIGHTTSETTIGDNLTVTGQFALINSASPGAHTDNQVFIGAKDSAGTGTDTLSTLQIFAEEGVDATALDAVGTLTTRIPIWVNDVCYWLYLDPV